MLIRLKHDKSVRLMHQGRISGGRVEKDVEFVAAEQLVMDEVDAAYRANYRRYAGRILKSVPAPGSQVDHAQTGP